MMTWGLFLSWVLILTLAAGFRPRSSSGGGGCKFGRRDGQLFDGLDATLLERVVEAPPNVLVGGSFATSTAQASSQGMGFILDVDLPTTSILNADAPLLQSLAPSVLAHLGDSPEQQPSDDDVWNKKRQANYNLNVGRALEALRRELPMVFAASNLDFSVFAGQILVIDQRQNQVVMHKNLYMTAVKSLRMAAAISSMYPSMNVKKIEYIEAEKTIQCLVDVVLPDTVRIDGQAVWEGMFYFGLDSEGLINSHRLDRRVSTKGPQPLNTQLYPWLRAMPSWSPDLVSIPVPERGALVRASEQHRDA